MRYFNGGLFGTVSPVELRKSELELIGVKIRCVYTKIGQEINPAIFGILFQHSMDKAERHALGAHFLRLENRHQRIVGITIVEPWQAGETLRELYPDLFTSPGVNELSGFSDPTCGGGDYSAYRFVNAFATGPQNTYKVAKAHSEKQFAA